MDEYHLLQVDMESLLVLGLISQEVSLVSFCIVTLL